MGVKDSNKVDVLAILETMRIYSSSFQDELIFESRGGKLRGRVDWDV